MEKGETMEKENTKPVKDEYGRLKLLMGVRNVAYLCYRTILVVFIILIPVMVVSKVNSNSKVESYEIAQGYVEELHVDEETNSKFPIISYQVGDETYEYQCDLKVTTMHPGEKVDVLYRANNPREATVQLQLTLFSELIWKVGLYCIGATMGFYIIFMGFQGLASDELKRVRGFTYR